MALIIFGAQNLMIKKQVKKFLTETFPNSNRYNAVYLNSHNITEGNIVDECEQSSLSADTKVVVIENSNFLTAERSKDKMSFGDVLLKYLKNENANTKLVFTVIYNKQLDSRNSVVKFVRENGKILECKDLENSDWKIYVSKYFERRNVTISNDAINEICRRCDSDLDIFINETDKLLLYKINNINIGDVKLIITKPLEDNLWDILDKLLHHKKTDAIEIYRDLLLKKVEPVVLISIISSSLLFIDRVMYLNSLSYNVYKISSMTSSYPRKVIETLNDFKNVDKNVVSKALDDLYLLDKTIKHNKVDRYYGFELFLLNF